MGKMMLWLAGADKEVLEQCPRESGRQVAMGATVATTSVLATLASTFTFHTFLHLPLAAALVLGLGWGLAIMNLDRWLMITIRRQKTPAKTIQLAAPRVFLALIVGLVISEPLVLVAFGKEVNAQAVRDKATALAGGREEMRAHYASIPALAREKEQLQERLRSSNEGEGLLQDPEYQSATSRLSKLEGEAAKARRVAIAELAGKSRTKKPGAGEVYRAKNQVADELEQRAAAQRAKVGALHGRLAQSEATLAAKGRRFDGNALRHTEAKLSTLEPQRDQETHKLLDAYREPTGLLDRVEALDNLTGDKPALLFVRIVFFLFILAFDVLPALGKTLMCLGEPSLYEQTQKQLEEADVQNVAHQVNAQVQANEIAASVIVDEAKTRKRYVEEVQEGLIQQAVAAMRDVGEKFVARWHEAIEATVDDQVEAELRRGGLGPDDNSAN